eukprot:11270581-Prorocentrum_lima.AAC.1
MHDAQQVLPQTFIVRKRHLCRMQAEDTGRKIPPHAQLVWREHHWVTVADLLALAARLQRSLRPWLHPPTHPAARLRTLPSAPP